MLDFSDLGLCSHYGGVRPVCGRLYRIALRSATEGANPRRFIVVDDKQELVRLSHLFN
jgi:hypothetical protein